MSAFSFPASHPVVAAPLPAPETSELETLAYLRQRLYQHVHAVAATADQPHQFLLEPQGRQHRVIVLDRDGLMSGGALTFVGFFGRRRPTADTSILGTIDNELIDEMRASPHMLSYSSLELPSGEWVNFVLMRGPEGLRHWSDGARHTYAARALAPSFYSAVRLHIGGLPHGLDPSHPLVVHRTRHIGFGHPTS